MAFFLSCCFPYKKAHNFLYDIKSLIFKGFSVIIAVLDNCNGWWVMSERSSKAGRKSQSDKRDELIASLWKEELESLSLWDSQGNVGWRLLPRTLPLIGRILDAHAPKGLPVSQTYTALWFRSFDKGFVETKDKNAIAFESGFSGQRSVSAWISRMRILSELGFISAKAGTSGEFQYVLLLDPFEIIKSLYKDREPDDCYIAFIARMNEVGTKW